MTSSTTRMEIVNYNNIVTISTFGSTEERRYLLSLILLVDSKKNEVATVALHTDGSRCSEK